MVLFFATDLNLSLFKIELWKRYSNYFYLNSVGFSVDASLITIIIILIKKRKQYEWEK